MMAIVKASYTRSRQIAKKAVRYIGHRAGRGGQRVARQLLALMEPSSVPTPTTWSTRPKKGRSSFASQSALTHQRWRTDPGISTFDKSLRKPCWR